MSSRARHWTRVVALGLGTLIGVFAVASPANAAPSGPPPGFEHAAATAGGQVVVAGVGGLSWADLSASATPNLWRLFDHASAAALSVRTVQLSTCPADGWLTVNTGVRATLPRPGSGGCAPIPKPQRAGGGADVPGWNGLGAYNAQFSYDPQLGLLAGAAAQRGCTSAVGPGGAIALADQGGHVQRYAATLAGADLAACPLTVIDLGSLPPQFGADRSNAVRQADAAIGRVETAAPQAQLLVAGLSDSSAVPQLRMVLARGDSYRGGWLTASSTRHDGLVQLTDLTPTILAALGSNAPPRAVGSVLRSVPGRPADKAEAVRRLRDYDIAAQTIDANVTQFYWLLALGEVIACGLLILARRSTQRHRRWIRVTSAAKWLVLFFAALPVSSFLANVVPWWRSQHPGGVLWAALLGWAVLIGGLAVTGPWRRQTFGPVGFLAAITASVLAVDVVTGSRLQLSSLWGLSPLDAGRFYGLGNVAFAAFAVTALVAAAWAATTLIRQGRRRAAAVTVAMIGVVAVAVDGWPSFGADFGGVLALIPGFALLTAGVGGLRVTLRRAVLVAVAALAAGGTIAGLDWARPPASRSHLGRFVQQALDGGIGTILRRKLDANLQVFAQRPALGLLVLGLLIATTVAVAWPQRLGVTGLITAYAAEPVLRSCLAACLLTAVVGLVVNDSGIIIPGIALAVALPLVVSVWPTAARPASPVADARQPVRIA
ncbi:hypothetical protein [Kribbella alba]|uniref:hypothetical protein n=1 Tax=Kribbella alba TaxID=190197 RepID=UPI0031E0636E